MTAWHLEARRLRAEEGLSVRQIAARLGKSRGGVQYALETEKDSKRPCPNCGCPMDRQGTQCDGCWHAICDVRRTLAEGMWADGWLLREMGDAYGVTPHFFTVQRAQRGWDLPHRYNCAGARTAA